MTSSHDISYYTILDVSRSQVDEYVASSRDLLKGAYHRALLLHHPDKTRRTNLEILAKNNAPANLDVKYTVDEIIMAYQTLSDPVLRRQYDMKLGQARKLNSLGFNGGSHPKGNHLGVETLDLDDLEFHEMQDSWSKSCRCGDTQGYTVTGAELEEQSDVGEILIGCHGCSLFIKVLFSSGGSDV